MLIPVSTSIGADLDVVIGTGEAEVSTVLLQVECICVWALVSLVSVWHKGRCSLIVVALNPL